MKSAFDLTKKLESTGFTREQAEMQIQAMSEMMTDSLATKKDLELLETRLSARIDQLEMKTNLQFQQMEYRLIIKLGTFMLIGFTAMSTLMKFWILH